MPRSGLPSAVAYPEPRREGADGTVGDRTGHSGPPKKWSVRVSSDAEEGTVVDTVNGGRVAVAS